MSNSKTAKKPASGDWHRADIKAALERAGTNLSRLSVGHGYHRTAASRALRTPWPQLERLIAQAIGRRSEEIWPSRYPANAQSSSAVRRHNVNK